MQVEGRGFSAAGSSSGLGSKVSYAQFEWKQGDLQAGSFNPNASRPARQSIEKVEQLAKVTPWHVVHPCICYPTTHLSGQALPTPAAVTVGLAGRSRILQQQLMAAARLQGRQRRKEAWTTNLDHASWASHPAVILNRQHACWQVWQHALGAASYGSNACRWQFISCRPEQQRLHGSRRT